MDSASAAPKRRSRRLSSGGSSGTYAGLGANTPTTFTGVKSAAPRRTTAGAADGGEKPTLGRNSISRQSPTDTRRTTKDRMASEVATEGSPAERGEPVIPAVVYSAPPEEKLIKTSSGREEKERPSLAPSVAQYRNFGSSVSSAPDSPRGRPRVNLQMNGIEVPESPSAGSSISVVPPSPGNKRYASDWDKAARKDAFIRVVARIRPQLPKEADEIDCVEVLDETQIVIRSETGEQKLFCVDEVFDSRLDNVTQATVYSRLGTDLIAQVLKGFNVCILAYGHTCSGKTYTMLGDGTGTPSTVGRGAGLLPRFVKDIFQKFSEGLDQTEEPKCTLEFYELYQESILDLLAPVGEGRKRVVHVHPRYGVRIEGLSSAVVKNGEEALSMLQFGNQMRTVASTTMNERSSRSHAIFTLRVEVAIPPAQGTFPESAFGEEKAAAEARAGTHLSSTIMFIDLAGREDQLVTTNKDERFREMCHINTSLFYLTHLITKLSDGQVQKGSLADFRNSKLTLLLSQALAGNCATACVATLAAAQCYYDDTQTTLNFAQKVKNIQTRPIVNNKTSRLVLNDLEAEVRSLKFKLNMAQGSEADRELELLAAQAMIDHYKTSWEEAVNKSENAKTLRKQAKGSRCMAGFCLDGEHGAAPCPFLTKLSDDPSLQGCCNFILGRAVLSIGCDSESDVTLKGVGLRAHMCTVHQDSERGEIFVELARSRCESDGVDESDFDDEDEEFGVEPPRVLVNGRALTHRERRRPLAHGDCLILGYAHAFRLVVPEPQFFLEGAGATDPGAIAKGMLASLDMETAVSEVHNDGEYKEMLPYVRKLQTLVEEKVLEDLLKGLNIVCPLIEEANMLSLEVLGHGGMRFEPHVNFNFDMDLPKLVISVIQAHAMVDVPKRRLSAVNSSGSGSDFAANSETIDSISDAGRSSSLSRQRSRSKLSVRRRPTALSAIGMEDENTLYVWTVEKFVRRLGEMRDIYQEGHAFGEGWGSIRRQMQAKPYLNPWQELAFADVKLLAADSGNAGKLWEDEAEARTPSVSGPPTSLSQLYAKANGERRPSLNKGAGAGAGTGAALAGGLSTEGNKAKVELRMLSASTTATLGTAPVQAPTAASQPLVAHDSSLRDVLPGNAAPAESGEISGRLSVASATSLLSARARQHTASSSSTEAQETAEELRRLRADIASYHHEALEVSKTVRASTDGYRLSNLLDRLERIISTKELMMASSPAATPVQRLRSTGSCSSRGPVLTLPSSSTMHPVPEGELATRLTTSRVAASSAVSRGLSSPRISVEPIPARLGPLLATGPAGGATLAECARLVVPRSPSAMLPRTTLTSPRERDPVVDKRLVAMQRATVEVPRQPQASVAEGRPASAQAVRATGVGPSSPRTSSPEMRELRMSSRRYFAQGAQTPPLPAKSSPTAGPPVVPLVLTARHVELPPPHVTAMRVHSPVRLHTPPFAAVVQASPRSRSPSPSVLASERSLSRLLHAEGSFSRLSRADCSSSRFLTIEPSVERLPPSSEA